MIACSPRMWLRMSQLYSNLATCRLERVYRVHKAYITMKFDWFLRNTKLIAHACSHVHAL